MKLSKKIVYMTILLAAFFELGKVAKAQIDDVDKYLKENVVETRLKNGIHVTLLNRGYSPTAALIISFKVGSADEEYKSIGIAHMLEHMLFKGTEKIGTRNYQKEKKILQEIEAVGETIDRIELKNSGNMFLPELKKRLKKLQAEHKKYVVLSPYSKMYSSMGGVGFNASTSRDRTSYYIELPSDKIEAWADLESKRLLNPVFRQYYLERGAVVQERLMRYGSIGASNLVEKFIATAFMAHPYRHPTIGWKSNVKYLSLKEVKKFYWKNYVPSKMNITVVGKQNADKTLMLLEKYFGKIKPRVAPPELSIREHAQKGERRVNVKFKASPYLIIGWHKPTAPSKDDYIGDIVSYLMTRGKNSFLKKELVEKQKIVLSVDSSNGFPGARFNNLFVVDAEPKSGVEIANVEKAIYESIQKLKNSVSDKNIKQVINKIRSETVFSMNSNMGIARKINYYASALNNWKYGVDYLKNIEKITVADVKKFIDKYLVQDNRTVGTLIQTEK
jgi:predicted Zn-dependent peptidase